MVPNNELYQDNWKEVKSIVITLNEKTGKERG